MGRREHILGTVVDMVSDFLYYDRRHDEDLPVWEIEQAIKAEEVSIDEIVNRFKEELQKHYKEFIEEQQ